jgi:two-component system, sensor histidine kinase and response regulator
MNTHTRELESRIAALEELLGTLERTIVEQSERLEHSREAESHLAAIVQGADIAIISLSLDFHFLTWNLAAERLFGYTQEETIGRRPEELFRQIGDGEHTLAEFFKGLEERRGTTPHARNYGETLQRKDGSMVDVVFVASGIYDANSRRTGVAFFVRDGGDRRRAEREQAALATIVKASQDAIIGFSKDIKITSWNPAAETLYGLTAQEAIGRGFDLFVPPEELGPALEADHRLFATGEPASFKQRGKKKDGTAFVSLISIFPIRDASGNIIAGAGIGRDITDLVRLEREQAALATIVAASEDAIISLSREMRIVAYNPAAEKVYGHTSKEAIGQGLDFFLPPEELPAAIAAGKHVAETGEPVTWEQRVPRKDGTTFISLVNIFPIRDAAGDIVEIAGMGRDITKFKQIEAELRAAHEYTRGLIESSIDAMVIVDPDMRISDGNEQLARLTELPKKVLFGSRFDSHFTDPAHAAEAVKKALTDGYVTNVDLTLRAASGKEVLVSFNASLFYRAGKVFGIFGVARDVTEQRAMERTLRQEREYSRSLVQSSPDALLVSDSVLMLTDVNERALELTNYGRKELLGTKLTSLFTEPAGVSGVLEQARDDGLVHDSEFFLLTKNAHQIPISLNASSFKEGDGSSRRIVVAMRDISESRRAQEANSLLASIVDSSADAICSVSPELIITSWNPAAEAMYGYSAAEAVGRSVALFVPLDRRAELAEHIQRIREGRTAEHYETVRLRKDGSTVDVAVTQSPIVDSSGSLVALSIIVRDISDRKRMEAELTEARDAALEGARLKSEFLANMSHEIRTPLNSIIGMTGLLLDTDLTDEQRDFAHDVSQGGDNLLSLINNILDFSKIAAGKLAFEETDFDLTPTVESVVQLVADQARRKGLELTVSIEPEVPRFLRGDPGRLRQVLLNLVSNAIKFTEHGEVAVQVSKLSENPKEAILRFEVRDSGIGIPPDKQHLLFQPFSQVDASTTRHYGGTGLGLSIARALVEAMQGTIAVSSAPGAGSTFWFTVTLAKQVDITKPASERFASLSGARILIVDDNANSRQVLDRHASSWGMKVSTATSAEEALGAMRGAAKTDPYQVALIDVMMPEVDGIELARMIKSDPALAAIAVVFISSAGSSRDFKTRLQGLDFGGWLMKPAPESSLYKALARVLEPSTASAAQTPPSLPKRAGEEPAAPVKLTLPAVHTFRLLLAEDNPINQKLAKLQLRKLGIDVDAVVNGREAVEAASRVPYYDAVLMDCQMPEMDGYDATREIRRREGAARHTLIVAMTAHALPGDREKCLAAGMDGYISKPVTIEALESALAEGLALSPSGRAAETLAIPPPTINDGSVALPASEPASNSSSDAPAAIQSQLIAKKTSADRHAGDVAGAITPASEPIATPAANGSATASLGAPATDPVCSQETLNQLRQEGEDFFRELIELFNVQVPKGMLELAQVLDAGDCARAAVIAHTLKGTAGTFGAKRMQELAAAIDQAARAGSVDKASSILEELHFACEQVREVLEAQALGPPAQPTPR